MAYNPYTAINEIYNLKGQWDSANNAGDEAKKNEAAAKAQTYYNQLKSNGYTGVANQLSASDYASAKAIRDKYYTLATADKTKTRPYLYSLGAKYGLSNSDVDKLISYDDVSGQVSFGGKVVGTPDTVVDGTSYWSDTSILDNAFNDYVSRSGLTRSGETQVTQENENLFAKYNQEYEDLKNTNPFTTDEAKAILAKYDLAGLQGRDNAVASGSASNGGNIDSFSAANALRQQASMITEGQGVVLEQYQQKLDHARNLLSDMGVNIDRVYNQNETSKNNDVARKSEIASVSGYTPDEWVVSNNPYLNDDGTLKDEYKDIDFSAVMANAKAAGNTEAYNAAATARYYKIMSDYGTYGQYDDGNYIVPGAKQTEAARQFDEQIAAADRQLNAEVSMNTANNVSAEKINAANNQNAIDQITTSAQYGTITKDSSATYQNGVKVGDKNGKPILTMDKAIEMYESGNTSDQVTYALNYYGYTSSSNAGTTLNNAAEWEEYYSSWSDKPSIQQFLTDFVKGNVYETSGTLAKDVWEDTLIQGIINNSEQYDIDVEDAKRICNKFGIDTAWLNDYKNRWGLNSKKGMKKD